MSTTNALMAQAEYTERYEKLTQNIQWVTDKKRRLVRSRRGWQDNIKIDIKEACTGGCGVNSSD